MSSKAVKWGTLAATGLLTLAYLGAGAAKLSGAEEMVQSFTKFGFPPAFMYFVGACEVAGAIGLWLNMTIVVPWPLRRLATVGLAIIMVGAITMHILHDPITMAVPAAVMLAILMFLFLRFGQTEATELAPA
jgi:putative oxidoreductase